MSFCQTHRGGVPRKWVKTDPIHQQLGIPTDVREDIGGRAWYWKSHVDKRKTYNHTGTGTYLTIDSKTTWNCLCKECGFAGKVEGSWVKDYTSTSW